MLKLIILNPSLEMLFVQNFYGVLKQFVWCIVFFSLNIIVYFYEGDNVFRDLSSNKVMYAYFCWLLMKSKREDGCGGICASL